MNKQEYTVQELIYTQSFRRLVKGSASDEEIRYWDEWIECSEKNRAIAREAMAEITGFKFTDPKIPDIEREWQELFKKTVGENWDKFAQKRRKYTILKWIQRLAAILIIGAMIGAGFYIYSPEDQTTAQLENIIEGRTVETESKEQKRIRFSNGSQIVLNSNSKVRYTINKKDQETINVILEGEAYFDAKSNPKSRNHVFAVNTPDGIIRDIGTEFLVTIEDDKSRVVLQKGKVQVDHNSQPASSSEISMSAGQMLEFNRSEVLNQKYVNPTFYTSWATGSMRFNETRISEFASFVEQRFDVEVQIKDPDLADIEIDGGIYFQSLEELIRSVSDIIDFPAYQSENRDTVYIGN